MKMQDMLLSDDKSVCMLVEVIAKCSQNKNWEITIDNKKYSHERIRRVSMDKFYEIVFGDKDAFCKLCKTLPVILDDVIDDAGRKDDGNSVFRELEKISPDIMRSIYLLAFKTYEGFDRF